MGSPRNPTAGQYSKLEAAGKLEEMPGNRTVKVRGGVAELELLLPRQGVSLIKLGW